MDGNPLEYDGKLRAGYDTRRDLFRWEALRYSCEWGYVHTAAAGERIRVLDLAEMALPSDLVAVNDFWLIDGERVVLMHYNSDYTFAGGELLDPSDRDPYRDAASVAWQLGRDFGNWWEDHPQYRRSAA